MQMILNQLNSMADKGYVAGLNFTCLEGYQHIFQALHAGA